MLDRAAPKDQILACIEDLKSNGYIDVKKYAELIRYVQAITGDPIDEGAIAAPQNQLSILTSTEAPQKILDRSLLLERIATLETKMQKLWDPVTKCYRWLCGRS